MKGLNDPEVRAFARLIEAIESRYKIRDYFHHLSSQQQVRLLTWLCQRNGIVSMTHTALGKLL